MLSAVIAPQDNHTRQPCLKTLPQICFTVRGCGTRSQMASGHLKQLHNIDAGAARVISVAGVAFQGVLTVIVSVQMATGSPTQLTDDMNHVLLTSIACALSEGTW